MTKDRQDQVNNPITKRAYKMSRHLTKAETYTQKLNLFRNKGNPLQDTSSHPLYWQELEGLFKRWRECGAMRTTSHCWWACGWTP